MGYFFALKDNDYIFYNNELSFILPKILSINRIGPHNKLIFEILTGSLLGDGWGEKRNNSIRFHIHGSNNNIEYLMWLYKSINNLGYCSNIKPKLITHIGKENKKYYSIKFRTWSFISFNFIYDEFYLNNIKHIPSYNF